MAEGMIEGIIYLVLIVTFLVLITNKTFWAFVVALTSLMQYIRRWAIPTEEAKFGFIAFAIIFPIFIGILVLLPPLVKPYYPVIKSYLPAWIIDAHAAGKVSEASYVKMECTGIIEFVLPDRTRVDCLTDTHAIEYDFGPKWAEAVGQSLHYAANTGRRAGIVLITPSKAQEKRLRILIRHYNLPIDVWVINEKIIRFEDLPK